VESAQIGAPALPIVHPWEATWWVRALAHLGPHFPSPDADNSVWGSYIMHCSYVPLFVLFLGLTAAAAILLCPCFRSCCAACAFRDERGPIRRPSPTNPFCVGLFTLTLLFLGGAAYWQTGAEATRTAQHELHRLVQDIEGVTDAAEALNSTAISLRANLEALPPNCAAGAARRQVKSIVSNASQVISLYQTSVAAFADSGSAVLTNVEWVQTHFRTLAASIGVMVSGPLALVVICCLLEFLAVCFARTGRCTRTCMCMLTPVIFAPTILAVAFSSSGQMWVGVTLSSFCKDVDANTLAWVGHARGTDSTIFQFTEYYLTENGTNPIAAELQVALSYVKTLQKKIDTLAPLAAEYCSNWTGQQAVTDELADVTQEIVGAEALMEYDRIHHYYSVAIESDACGTVIIGLGWLVLSQVIVGLCMLPLLTCASDDYLHRRILWHEARLPFLAQRSGELQVRELSGVSG